MTFLGSRPPLELAFFQERFNAGLLEGATETNTRITAHQSRFDQFAEEQPRATGGLKMVNVCTPVGVDLCQ